jgi:hypothetical protein
MRSSAEGVVSKLPLFAPDGDDHGAGSLPDPELADGVVGDERVLRDPELFEPELDPLLAPRDDVQEVNDQGLGREGGKPPPPDGVGREGAVGPSYLELGGALVGAGSGDDVDLGVQLAGREHNEDVVGV